MRTLLHPASKSPALTDLALLLSRVALGVILLAHGWQKLNEYTIAGTAASFAQMGVPAPTVAATFATAVELVGGAALILGLLTPVVALFNVVNLLGALVLVHAGKESSSTTVGTSSSSPSPPAWWSSRFWAPESSASTA